MKRRTLLQTLTVGAALLLLLTSCKGGNGTTDDTTGKGTTAETEAATAIPRYDYMDATVAPDVSIKREDYTNLSLTIPNSLKITDEDVAAYILNIRFQRRTADNGTAMVKDQIGRAHV